MWLLVPEKNKGRQNLFTGSVLSRISYWASSHWSIELMPPHGCVIHLDFCVVLRNPDSTHCSVVNLKMQNSVAHTQLAVPAAAEAAQVATGQEEGRAGENLRRGLSCPMQ